MNKLSGSHVYVGITYNLFGKIDMQHTVNSTIIKPSNKRRRKERQDKGGWGVKNKKVQQNSKLHVKKIR